MGNWNEKLGALALVGLMLAAPALRAEDMTADESLEELRSTLADLSAKVNTVDSAVKAVKFGGDFRYRYEHTDTVGGNINRERQRIRLRLKMDGKVNDWSKVIVQLATGGASGVSTNQTLGSNYFQNQVVSFDKAYLVVNPDLMFKPVLNFGKMATPFQTPDGEMIFDGDLTPEGISLQLSQNLGPISVDLIGATFQVNEVGGSSLDPKIEGGQLVLGAELLGMDLKLASMYLNGQNLAGGMFDPDLFDNYAEVGANVAGVGVKAFYEYVLNTTSPSDKEKDAYITGISLASGKLFNYQKDFIKLSYNYRSSRKNATIEQIDFSDFNDGTNNDAWGNQTGIKVKAADNVELGLTHIDSWSGASTVALGGKAGFFELWQVDLVTKF